MLNLVVFIAIALGIFARVGGRKYSKRSFYFAVFILIIYSGLRDADIYPDIINYFDFFRGQETIDVGNFGMGYTILNRICRFISPSFQFFLFVTSIIVIVSYAKTIVDYSPYIWLSLILYLLINYYPSFFLLRQYLAMAIFLLSLKYVINREPVKFGLCTLLAFSFHATAIITIPIYFLYGMKASIRNFLLLICACLAVIIVFASLGGYVEQYSAYYAMYFDMDTEESAWQRALMKFYIAAVYLYVMKKNAYNEGINRIIFYSMVFNVVICVGAMNIFSVHRIREYFALADFIGIPIIIKEANLIKGVKKPLAIFLVLVYIIALYVSFNSFIMGGNMNNEYHLFFNK